RPCLRFRFQWSQLRVEVCGCEECRNYPQGFLRPFRPHDREALRAWVHAPCTKDLRDVNEAAVLRQSQPEIEIRNLSQGGIPASRSFVSTAPEECAWPRRAI